MGIDAMMLVRNVPESTVTDEWLKDVSWRLCEAIGAEKFFLGYDDKKWTAINRSGSRWREDGDPPPGAVYEQDGDDIKAEPGECLLSVSLGGRYYGEGYERGDLLTYCAIAEWLEVNIPGCSVWYGGDSSGVCAKPFSDAVRRKLRAHLFSPAGRSYFRSSFGNAAYRPEPCAVCPGGQYCGTQRGTGPNYAAFHCAGCGESTHTRDGGKTWVKSED